ncbi:Rrf2 family transcriptional regulator [Arhodomonas sp. AD133]|uniref:Rrf2 family transcriptional regulator n=1 Tax=Arhodomonas sp. AD133 TaxID=3415009 RepID=UPI003EBE8D0B
MRLTLYSDYCLRVLIYLGLKDGELATIREIAERYEISRNHLMKVVYELNRLGYIETLRGKHGGMRLNRPPEEVALGALIRQTENDLQLVECFGSENRCRLTGACTLQSVLDEALQAFLDVLDRYTLADLLMPQQPLLYRLGLPASGTEHVP